jgi:hypothetical protein
VCFIAWCRACIESSGMMLHLLVINQRIKGEADEWGTIALFSDSTISLFVSIEFVIEHYIRRLTMSTRGAECRLHRVELRHPRCRIPCRVFVFRELANDGNSYRLSWITHISTIRPGREQKRSLICFKISQLCYTSVLIHPLSMYHFCMFRSKYCTKQSVHVAIGTFFLSQNLEANYLISFFTEFPMRTYRFLILQMFSFDVAMDRPTENYPSDVPTLASSVDTHIYRYIFTWELDSVTFIIELGYKRSLFLYTTIWCVLLFWYPDSSSHIIDVSYR